MNQLNYPNESNHTLNNMYYKFTGLVIGLIFIYVCNISHNTFRYNLSLNDTDISIYNYTLAQCNYNVTKCIENCDKVLNNMNFYRTCNGAFLLLLLIMSCFNFNNEIMRNNFCLFALFGLIVNILGGSIIILMDIYKRCFNVINEQYNYIQSSFYINYAMLYVLICVFISNFALKYSQLNKINNTNNINNINNYEKLPEYTDIEREIAPPEYSANIPNNSNK